MSGKVNKRLRKFAKKMGDKNLETINSAKKEYKLLNKTDKQKLNVEMGAYNRIGE